MTFRKKLIKNSRHLDHEVTRDGSLSWNRSSSLSQIRRSFDGISRDRMFDVDWEIIKCPLSGGNRAASPWATRVQMSIQTEGIETKYAWNGLASGLLEVCILPQDPYSRLDHRELYCGICSSLRSQTPCAHSWGMGASSSWFVIAFVESSHQLMANHQKVDIKMDYLTPQTDNNSFIILCLAVALSWKPHGSNVPLRGSSSEIFLYLTSWIIYNLFHSPVKAAAVCSD